MKTIFILFTLSVSLFAKEVAISFDDAPRRLTGHFSALGRAKALTTSLKKVGINDVVFYCNSSFITKENYAVLKYYDDHGFTLANHTDSHLDFNKTSFKDYKVDFLKADKTLSQFKNFKRYFRFPYLREGNEKSKRDKMRSLLKEKGYINGYITVDFNDWHLEDLFRRSLKRKEKVDLEKLKKLYISLAKESLEHSEKLSQKYLGRSVKHVLLLHETDLAALFIDDLVLAMKSWGWKIISSQEAYKDQLEKFRIQKPLKRNPGRIGEIAIENNHPMKDLWPHSTSPKYISDRYAKEVL